MDLLGLRDTGDQMYKQCVRTKTNAFAVFHTQNGIY